MESTNTTVHTFSLRELQCQDESGRQVVLRVDDHGDTVCAGVFDQQGRKIEEIKGRIQLDIVIRCPDKRDAIATMRLCCYPNGQGGVYCVPC